MGEGEDGSLKFLLFFSNSVFLPQSQHVLFKQLVALFKKTTTVN